MKQRVPLMYLFKTLLRIYKGDIVEELDAFHLADAKHPYTKVLLSSIFEIGKPHNPLSMDTVTNDTNI